MSCVLLLIREHSISVVVLRIRAVLWWGVSAPSEIFLTARDLVFERACNGIFTVPLV